MNDDKDSTTKTAGRVLLPDNIVPTRYCLKIKPDLDAFTFEGQCKIVLKTTNVEGNQIKLHAKELCFSKASFVVHADGNTSLPTPVECEEVRSRSQSLIKHRNFHLCVSNATNQPTFPLISSVSSQRQDYGHNARLYSGHSVKLHSYLDNQLHWFPEQPNGRFLS